MLLRYDLVTLEEELVVPVPISAPLGEIAIGAASERPLLICGEGYSRSWCAHELMFVDPETSADLGTKFFSNSPDRTTAANPSTPLTSP